MVVVIILYDLRVNFIRHVIALLYRYELAIVVVAIVGGDNYLVVHLTEAPRRKMMEIMPHAQVMKIKGAKRRAIPYHIIHACDEFIPFMHLILRVDDGSIIR
jgi:hypothetical protein